MNREWVISYVMQSLAPTHNWGLGSLTFCSSINKVCFWRTCIKNDKSKENQCILFHTNRSYADLQDLFKIALNVIY